MSVARVTEISATSKQSFEDAIQSGLERANETIHGITSAWVKEQTIDVKDGKIVEEIGLDDGVAALTQLGLIKTAA